MTGTVSLHEQERAARQRPRLYAEPDSKVLLASDHSKTASAKSTAASQAQLHIVTYSSAVRATPLRHACLAEASTIV